MHITEMSSAPHAIARATASTPANAPQHPEILKLPVDLIVQNIGDKLEPCSLLAMHNTNRGLRDAFRADPPARKRVADFRQSKFLAEKATMTADLHDRLVGELAAQPMNRTEFQAAVDRNMAEVMHKFGAQGWSIGNEVPASEELRDKALDRLRESNEQWAHDRTYKYRCAMKSLQVTGVSVGVTTLAEGLPLLSRLPIKGDFPQIWSQNMHEFAFMRHSFASTFGAAALVMSRSAYRDARQFRYARKMNRAYEYAQAMPPDAVANAV